MTAYLVNFIYPVTTIMATVDVDPDNTYGDGHMFDEYEIAETADEAIYNEIGFAPLQYAQDWTVEELN